MIKQQVKAFTMIEITITMLITSILVGLTYTSYVIINKSWLGYNGKHKSMAEIEQLNALLTRDFDRSDLISRNDSGLVMVKSNFAIHYQFDTAYIVRLSTIADTFKIKTKEWASLFEGLPIDKTDSFAEKSRTDELDITVLFQGEEILFNYRKQYSSADLIPKSNAGN